jgi:hypothetical protein
VVLYLKDNAGKKIYSQKLLCRNWNESMVHPCKDSQTNEPDKGAAIKVAVQTVLMNVSNGRFIKKI